ncbi:MAG: hypothetical protein IPJ41_05190 [Phycisphaerales bacterium]|nr:hypothetical protein [Phycisphaerales bacterium]
MTRDGLALALGTLLLAAGLAHADTILYQNDFEKGSLGSEWSSNSVLDQSTNFTRFNGRYSNAGITLVLPLPPSGGGKTSKSVGNVGQIGGVGGVVIGGGLGGGGGGGGGGGNGDGGGGGGGGGGDGGGGGGGQSNLYTVSFDFYAIDSWDGDGPNYGPDLFEVRINNNLLFHETFSNGDKPQSFRAPDIGPAPLGYSANWDDSIYRNIALTLELPSDTPKLFITWVGSGLQGVLDESWGIDNLKITRSQGLIPAPATLTPAAALLLLGARRRTR